MYKGWLSIAHFGHKIGITRYPADWEGASLQAADARREQGQLSAAIGTGKHGDKR